MLDGAEIGHDHRPPFTRLNERWHAASRFRRSTECVSGASRPDVGSSAGPRTAPSGPSSGSCRWRCAAASRATKRIATGVLNTASRSRTQACSSASLALRAGREMDHRRRLLAQRAVRHADQRAVGHRGMRVEHVLDLGRIDVLAAADHHVLGAVDDVDEALLVEPREVAGADPAVDEGRRASPRACSNSPSRSSARAPTARRPRPSAARSTPSSSMIFRSATATGGPALVGRLR